MTSQYKIITVEARRGFLGIKFEEAAEQLTEEVNREIAAGWEPQGGVCVGSAGQGYRSYLFQALVRRR